MADCNNWDIPDPGCFESCPPETCGPCSAGNIFSHPHKLPGVPVGRVVVPLVRVNGQVQDLNAGGFIGNQFLEPPHMSWDPQEGILNIGGRFIKLTGMAMSYSDCHGMPVTPCTPLMTCKNFAEIIDASTGIGFKDPNNPFAGLTIFLAPNSGLIVNNNGLKIDAAAVCQMLKDIGCTLGGTPVPPAPPTPEPPGPGPTPPGPSPTPEVISRSGIPGYQCHNSGNTQLQNMLGSHTITWTETSAGSGIGTISVSPAGPTLGYSGFSAGASLIWAGGTLPKATFNQITLLSAATVCAAPPTPEPPGPTPEPPGPTPEPPTPPAPDTSPKNISITGCVGMGSLCSVSWSANSMSYTFVAGGASEGTCTFVNGSGGAVVNGPSSSGCNGLSPVSGSVGCTDAQYASITAMTVTNCASCV